MGFFLVRLLSLGLAFGAVPLSLILLFVAESLEGRVFAVAGLLISFAPLAGCISVEKKSIKLAAFAGGAFALWAAAVIWLGCRAPDGHSLAGARVRHCFVGDHWRFQRFALGNLLPELDQFLLGFRIVPAVDPLFTLKQAGQLSGLTSAIYHELESDSDFHALGSVMPQTYGELWGLTPRRGHYILYTPPNLDRSHPSPVLLFLHGSGGNFKAYTWLLSRVADDLSMILIAPSNGLGNWREPAATADLSEILDDANRRVLIQPNQIHLMGLSNGGLGVSRASFAFADQFQSLTFLSPVFDDVKITSTEWAGRWKDKPVFIMTGTVDDRVPLSYVEQTVDDLQQHGSSVALRTVPGADHFMLFSHHEEVLSQLTVWLKSALVQAASKTNR